MFKMREISMRAGLFFMVLSAWCASPDFWKSSFDIPSSWVRGHDKGAPIQRWCSDRGQNLQGISIMPGVAWDNIIFNLCKKDLFIGMDSSACDLDRGTLFEVTLFCHSCNSQVRGYVVSTPQGGQQRGFSVLDPTGPGSTFVHFSKIDAHRPREICEYRAEETRFTVKRFLCEYNDLSRYVVSTEVTYDNPHNVVIEWGLREANGAMQVTDEKTQQVFKLRCHCAQNTES